MPVPVPFDVQYERFIAAEETATDRLKSFYAQTREEFDTFLTDGVSLSASDQAFYGALRSHVDGLAARADEVSTAWLTGTVPTAFVEGARQHAPAIAFNAVHDRAVRELSGYSLDLITQMNDGMRRIVQQQVAVGMLEGASREVVAERLKKSGLSNIPRWRSVEERAEVIARTETMRAYNAGNLSGIIDTGAVAVRWITGRDEWVCGICGPRNGRIFRLPNAESDDPDVRRLDPLPGQPPAHPRCRCTVRAQYDFDERTIGTPTRPAPPQGGIIEAQRDAMSPEARFGGGSTDELHKLPDGSWTPERARLHADIERRIMRGVEAQKNPVATFMGGGPASGKSVTLDSGLVKLPANHASIDPDFIKNMLPEYVTATGERHVWAAAFVHEESSYLAKQIAARAAKKRVNLVLDGTGDSGIDSLTRKVTAARAGGQRAVAEYVTVDTETAVLRATTRGARTGRVVPEDYIRSVHADVSRTFPQAIERGLFDEARLWDTGSMPPKLVAEYRDGVLKILEPDLWESFLAKAGPVPVPTSVPINAASRQIVADRMTQSWARIAEVWAEEYPSVEAVQAAVTANVKKLVAQGEVRVRVEVDDLSSILADGRFKTQFEVRSSGGKYDRPLRERVEEFYFGYGDDLPVTQRPVYGYLGGAGDNSRTEQYGNIVVQLKPSVRQRSTVTFYDSVDAHQGTGTIWGNGRELVASPLDDPDYLSVMPWDAGQLYGDMLSIDSLRIVPGYPEVQVHGGVRLDDIEEVVFTGLGPMGDVFRLLTEHNIPWRVDNDFVKKVGTR